MAVKPEDITPGYCNNYSKDERMFRGPTQAVLTLAECAQIAIDYSVAVLDYVNGQYETQINGELLKEKYDALFAKWLIDGAKEKAITRNAREIARFENAAIIEELKLQATLRGDII